MHQDNNDEEKLTDDQEEKNVPENAAIVQPQDDQLNEADSNENATDEIPMYKPVVYNEPNEREDYTKHNHKEPRRKGSWLTPILLGVIIGILLTTVAVPAFIKSGFVKPVEDTNDVNDSHNGGHIATKTQHVSVDVSTQITEVVAEVSPTVVGVTNIQSQADFWHQQTQNEAGTGSGVIYKIADGYAYVITNHHVVERADLLEVVLEDETTLEAELLGSDLFTDLAVLRIDGSQVDKVIEIGSSDSVKVGEPAIAIGNPLGHMFSGSVTQGVISGTQRTIPLDFNQDGRADWQAEVIQTDAAINPGNSGGALINVAGQLIGINSMKINQTAVEGIGFAIPIDTAWPVIEELEKTGEVVRPYMGVEIYSLDEVPKAEWTRTLKLPQEVDGGIYVWSVEPLSPSDHAGIERLDVITELDGKKIDGTLDLRKILYQEKKIGDELQVVYYRDGKRHETTVVLSTQ